jgi:hypothetical protein
LELVNWSVNRGQQTLPTGVVQDIDGVDITNLYLGARFAFDSPGDFGEFDMGLASGFALTSDTWYQGILRFEIRWIR